MDKPPSFFSASCFPNEKYDAECSGFVFKKDKPGSKGSERLGGAIREDVKRNKLIRHPVPYDNRGDIRWNPSQSYAPNI